MISIKLQFIREIRKSVNHFIRPFVLLFVLGTLSGCATITYHDGGIKMLSAEEFDLYASDVFKRQNQASTEIIMYLIDYEDMKEAIEYQKLLKAEEEITDACKPLNNMAVTRAERRPVSFLLKYMIIHTIHKCDSVTRNVEAILAVL